ncbi:hypothetical protein HY990_01355 [Candidatus Micrarchaeota archaeon]|nr:hypothetical protein [Candidatus Micrarchaeota archaeon]
MQKKNIQTWPFLLLAILSITIVTFGCTSKNNGNSQADRELAITCEESCIRTPHIQCSGKWNISGTYPSCRCEFTCDTVTEQATGEENVTTNINQSQSAPPQNNSQNIRSTNQTQTQYQDNRTLEKIIEDETATVRRDFYNQAGDGSFHESRYTLINPQYEMIQSNEISLGMEYSAFPKINNETNREVQGFSGLIFKNSDERIFEGAYGTIIIFSNSSSMLRQQQGEVFDLAYSDKRLRNCIVYSTNLIPRASGELSSSYFRCTRTG